MSVHEPANKDKVGDDHWRSFLRSIGGYQFLLGVAEEASGVIMEIYQRSSIERRSKEDGSPVSEADMAAAAVIETALLKTGIPVVCEEGACPNLSGQKLFWLVDPLDGTKEFLARNGEFTVNIALVSDGYPVVGVIAIPAHGEVYVGVRGEGTIRLKDDSTTKIINSRTTQALIAAVSRSYGSSETDQWLERFGVTERMRCGSAIKFCRVAEGRADIYVRLGRTMEWDTGAGQVIVEEAGGKVLALPSQARLEYGKPGFANPDFIAVRGDIDLSGANLNKVGNLFS